MPGVFRCDLTNACAFYHYHCTRGYRAHRAPGIPCALFSERAGPKGKTRAKTRGEIAKSCTVISPPSTRLCAWRGPRRAKLALEVGGGGDRKARGGCGGGGFYRFPPGAAILRTPPPPPPPPRRFAGGGERLW